MSGGNGVTSTILVVDDEDLVRAQISASLELDGFQVAQAANGDEALAWLRDNVAAIMVTDILMPAKDGIETIRDARRLYPSLKIIAMSGGIRTNAPDVLDTARQVGADRILAKPFGRAQLIALLRELLPASDAP